MDFFQHQDQARRNTTKLVVLMVLAVVSLIAMITAVVAGFVLYFQFDANNQLRAYEQGTDVTALATQVLSWELLGTVAFIVGCIVALGSVYKILQMRGGGHTVAEAMGGRLLDGATTDADERKILNVVEEIAIASGTPVPPVYLLDDDSINAFAAGFKPQDAVIGITRGCIRLLSREELQGVIAHEFSHILYGDMRLNIRLVGVLHGILVIGLIGYFITRGAGYGAMARSRRGNNAAALFFAGLALTIIGFAGTFFGNLIKAAVSRQREFLADASAVQFTRNPDGISGALKKIGGHSAGSMLASPHAAEFSHMYFSQGVHSRFNALFATHPPLEERVQRIDPTWDGEFPRVAAAETSQASSGFSAGQASQFAAAAQPASEATGLDNVGTPTPEHVAQAQQMLTAMPATLRDAAHDPFAARALIYSLLLDKESPDVRQQQWQHLREGAHPVVFQLTEQYADQVGRLDRTLHLPLLELSIPALKMLSTRQYQVFKRNMVALIRADRNVNLFEWSLYRVVTHAVEPAKNTSARLKLTQLKTDCVALLTVLARAGHHDEAAAGQACKSALAQLDMQALDILKPNTSALSDLNEALDRLNQLKPLEKPRLLKAMATCVSHDGDVTPTEMELFRAIADSLDCPMPPLLPQQKLV